MHSRHRVRRKLAVVCVLGILLPGLLPIPASSVPPATSTSWGRIKSLYR